MKKRVFPLALVLAAALVWCAPVLAAEGEVEVSIDLNGYDLTLDQPVLARDGVTFVPVEEFCVTLGGEVETADSQPLPGGILYRWAEDGSNVLTVSWYDREVKLVPGEGGAAFRGGILYAPLRPLAEGLGLTVDWDGMVELSCPKKQVAVNNLEDLFNAIGPDTQIMMEAGDYSFGDLDVENIHNPYVYVDYNVFDTAAGEYETGNVFQVVIKNVRDLEIDAAVYNGGVRVSTPWAYADVWRFENCRRVTMNSGTAVHDVEPGSCAGNCVELENCRDVFLVEMTLDGSGAYGFCAYNSRNVTLAGVVIQNCTYGAVSLWDSEHIKLLTCKIQNCVGCFHLLNLCNTTNVLLEGCYAIEGNAAGALVETSFGSRNIVIENCLFRENSFGTINAYGWQSSGGAVFINCEGLEG